MPCANARRRLRSPPSATSASGCLEKSVQRPSPTRYTAPAILTAVNATADDTTSAESPSVAAVMCTSVPTWMPSTEAMPARRPCSIERATT